MPTFIIHALNKPATKLTFDAPRVQVGRDPDCDIVLPDEAVSRSHAVFARSVDGRWSLQCVSATNPVVVDGHVVTTLAPVSEGTEVLVGGDHLIIFSENAFKADEYIQIKSHYERKRCPQCRWEGMTSSLRVLPCPRCGHAALDAIQSYKGSPSTAPQVETAAMKPEDARALFSKIRAARMSYIERADGKVEGVTRAELSESRGVTLGPGDDPALKVFGLHVGTITIAWSGEHFEARSGMLFPAMRVNGEKTKTAPLRNGDVIEVGSNQFRFATT